MKKVKNGFLVKSSLKDIVSCKAFPQVILANLVHGNSINSMINLLGCLLIECLVHRFYRNWAASGTGFVPKNGENATKIW